MIPLLGTSTVPVAFFLIYSTLGSLSPILKVMSHSFLGFHTFPSVVVISVGVYVTSAQICFQTILNIGLSYSHKIQTVGISISSGSCTTSTTQL